MRAVGRHTALVPMMISRRSAARARSRAGECDFAPKAPTRFLNKLVPPRGKLNMAVAKHQGCLEIVGGHCCPCSLSLERLTGPKYGLDDDAKCPIEGCRHPVAFHAGESCVPACFCAAARLGGRRAFSVSFAASLILCALVSSGASQCGWVSSRGSAFLCASVSALARCVLLCALSRR